MTKIRTSDGRIVAHVDAYAGAHRMTYAARHRSALVPAGGHLNAGAHAYACECRYTAGYVCLTHKTR
jgi:hypothetical protein